ncbi:MAG: SGNH/GDSL hydrolase family protein [Leptospiraceae bacterium]|nr:SGNH/GDSL hydrolase family protein [Leptospiraceae bacterium]
MPTSRRILIAIFFILFATSISAEPLGQQLEDLKEKGYDLQQQLDLQFRGGSDTVCPDQLYVGGLMGATCPGYRPIPGFTAFTMIGDSRTDFARGHGDWHHRCMLGKYNPAPVHDIAIAGSTAANWKDYLNGPCDGSQYFSDDVVIMIGGNDILGKLPQFVFDVFNGPRTLERITDRAVADTNSVVQKLRGWNKDVIVQGHYNANLVYGNDNIIVTWIVAAVENSLINLDNKTRIAFTYPHRSWCQGGFEILFWFWWGRWWPFLQWNNCLIRHEEGQNDAGVSYAPIPQFFTPEMFNDGVHLSKFGYPVHAYHLIRSLLARGFY